MFKRKALSLFTIVMLLGCFTAAYATTHDMGGSGQEDDTVMEGSSQYGVEEKNTPEQMAEEQKRQYGQEAGEAQMEAEGTIREGSKRYGVEDKNAPGQMAGEQEEFGRKGTQMGGVEDEGTIREGSKRYGVTDKPDADQEQMATGQQDQQQQMAEQQMGQQQVGEYYKQNLVSAEHLMDQNIAFQDKDLSVSKLLVDPQNGDVPFVVVSSGTAGMGGEQHMLPFNKIAFQSQDQIQIAEAADISLDERTQYSPEQQGRMTQEEVATYERESGYMRAGTGAEEEAMGQKAQQNLVEIDALADSDIKGANDETIGQLETVLIDAEQGKAKMIVMDSGDFLGLGGEKYLVPFNKVNISQDGQQVSLNVTEDELNQFSKASEVNWDGNTLPRQDAQGIYGNYTESY
jgi:sporulation protein YlmC with PRC-barrel domain